MSIILYAICMPHSFVFAREAAAKNLPSRVICPENKGDRFMLRFGERR
ncbi:MAG: hypothetical protein WAU81_13420 [Candidatus Aminicenantales bacterium]